MSEEQTRKSLACWICRDLLDAFDPDGRHC